MPYHPTRDDRPGRCGILPGPCGRAPYWMVRGKPTSTGSIASIAGRDCPEATSTRATSSSALPKERTWPDVSYVANQIGAGWPWPGSRSLLRRPRPRHERRSTGQRWRTMRTSSRAESPAGPGSVTRLVRLVLPYMATLGTTRRETSVRPGLAPASSPRRTSCLPAAGR